MTSVQRPTTQEVSRAKATVSIIKQKFHATHLPFPDWLRTEIDEFFDKINAWELAAQVKMSVPTEQEVLNWKWFEGGTELAVLYFKEYPDRILTGATASEIEAYYSSMNIRGQWNADFQRYDGIDAGPPHQLDRRLRELANASFLAREYAASQTGEGDLNCWVAEETQMKAHAHPRLLFKPTKLLLERIES